MNTLINHLGMEFVWIEPGEFLMGSSESELGRNSDETQHKVILTKGFYAQSTQVTQKQWQEFMGNNPSRFQGEDDNPVERVSWNDCQEFIAKLNRKADTKKLGIVYRLPTEAEWEYACRAGTTTAFWWGNTIDPTQANYDGNHIYNNGKKGECHEKTTPVKTFKPNPLGLYDMHGNVWEWCYDWYGVYPNDTTTDPVGLSISGYRVIRGSSWCDFPDWLRSASRNKSTPDTQYSLIGFRLVANKLNII
jgi:formylglycine-generating enzyme